MIRIEEQRKQASSAEDESHYAASGVEEFTDVRFDVVPQFYVEQCKESINRGQEGENDGYEAENTVPSGEVISVAAVLVDDRDCKASCDHSDCQDLGYPMDADFAFATETSWEYVVLGYCQDSFGHKEYPLKTTFKNVLHFCNTSWDDLPLL